jgi:hypothetical protein
MPQACNQCGTAAVTMAGALCPACLMRLATMPESRVPDFAIETLLGSGTGTTYLARARDGSLLAVKQIGAAGERGDALGDLDDALRAADHPHLARTIALDVDDAGTVQLIRAFVPGRAFADWLSSAPEDARATARAAVASALAHLHDAGLAHGHIAAANIVIGAGGRAILMDAGARPALLTIKADSVDFEAMRQDDVERLGDLFRT